MLPKFRIMDCIKLILTISDNQLKVYNPLTGASIIYDSVLSVSDDAIIVWDGAKAVTIHSREITHPTGSLVTSFGYLAGKDPYEPEKLPTRLYKATYTGYSGGLTINNIKKVRQYTGLGLKDAKDVVYNPPYVIDSNLTQSEAQFIKADFAEINGYINIEPTGYDINQSKASKQSPEDGLQYMPTLTPVITKLKQVGGKARVRVTIKDMPKDPSNYQLWMFRDTPRKNNNEITHPTTKGGGNTGIPINGIILDSSEYYPGRISLYGSSGSVMKYSDTDNVSIPISRPEIVTEWDLSIINNTVEVEFDPEKLMYTPTGTPNAGRMGDALGSDSSPDRPNNFTPMVVRFAVVYNITDGSQPYPFVIGEYSDRLYIKTKSTSSTQLELSVKN